MTVGEILRDARHRKGVSLEQAQAATRIRLRYLQALEEDDPAILPSPVYVRGFLRNYAQYLGLIPEEIVDLYRREHRQIGQSTLGEKPYEPIRTPIPRSTWTPPTAAMTFSAVLVLVLALNWAYARVFPSEQQRQVGQVAPQDLAGIAVVDTPVPPTPTPTETPPTPTATATVTRQQVVMLDLKALRATTIRVVVDGEVRFEGQLRPGTLQVWSGRSVTVRAANGDAVEVSVNGRKDGPLGPNAQPIERQWRLEG